jgi:hypothetical protein
MRSSVLIGDALNPSTWPLARMDSGQLIPVAAVTQLSPTSVVLRTLLPLPPFTAQAALNADGLLDSLGNLFASPRLFVFAGLTEAAISTPALEAASRTISQKDLQNIPAPDVDGGISGTLAVMGGDYVNQSGVDLLRKLIIRRIITTPGDFFHIPNYGVGLRVKEPIPTGDLIKLKTLVATQIRLEPEVDDVVVGVAQNQNQLTVTASVRVKATGQRLQVGASAMVGS